MSYTVGLDKNGDGFICMDAQAGDALNLLPTPLTYDALSYQIVGGGSISLESEQTAYGIRRLRVSYPGAVTSFELGYPGDEIPVTAGSTYSVGFWLRGTVDYSAQIGSLLLEIRDQDGNSINQVTYNGPGTAWERLQISFTAPAGTTHIMVGLQAGGVIVDAAGFMLVAGSALPDGYNTGDPQDLDERITPDVLEMQWRLGLRRPYDSVARPAEAEITLYNSDGRYSPELSSMALSPGTPVQIRADDITLFSGVIGHVAPTAGDDAGRTAALHVVGPDAYLPEISGLSAFWVNVRPGTLIEYALNHPWLGRFNQLIDNGVSIFAYAGDTWSDDISAASVIRQVTTAERGRFFVDRRGQMVFYERDRLNGVVSQATFSNAFAALRYSYGEDLVNQVRVVVRPREVGTPGTVIWQLSRPQLIPAGSCRQITARPRDSAGNPIGASNIIPPAAGTDYTANTANDGTGTNVTAQFSVNLIADASTTGRVTVVEVCNNSPDDAYLLAGAQLRGTPLIQGDRLVVEEMDAASVAQHGPQTLVFNQPYFVDLFEAEDIAAYELNRRAQPRGAVREITLSDRVRFADALALTLFDRITITEGRTGHSADYFIVAEEHTVELGGARHQVTWLLEPTSD